MLFPASNFRSSAFPVEYDLNALAQHPRDSVWAGLCCRPLSAAFLHLHCSKRKWVVVPQNTPWSLIYVLKRTSYFFSAWAVLPPCYPKASFHQGNTSDLSPRFFPIPNSPLNPTFFTGWCALLYTSRLSPRILFMTLYYSHNPRISFSH